MTFAKPTLPDDPEQLKTLVMEIAASHTTLEEAVSEKETMLEEQEIEISYLREQLRLLRHQRYGSSSEKLSDEQLLLMLESEGIKDRAAVPEIAETVAVKEHQRIKRGRKPIPADLPRIEVLHDVSPEEKVCPHDGHALKRIGEEKSEQLSYTPAQMRVLLHIRPKYACPVCEEGVKIAPPPPQAIPKSMATPSLLAHVAVSKYADSLPLYRQEKMFARIGVDLPRSTLSGWMIRSGELIQVFINLLRDELLGGPIVQCDETRCQVLKEPGKRAESQSYLWAQRGGQPGSPVILFDYDPSRGGDVPKRLLAGYEGYLQVDGYKGYDAFCAENQAVCRVGCWAHARRKFDEAYKAQRGLKGRKGKPRREQLKKSNANQGLDWIRKLYEIERDARGLSARERQEIREARSQPILDAIKEWLPKAKAQVPPKSLTGVALGYVSGHWKHLTRFMEDGRLEIDNNLVENAIRPFALGRRNWLFSDTVQGAEAGANLYSLIETAKANGIEPYKYLCLVFRDLPKANCVEDYERLLPSRWTNESIQTTLDEGRVPI